MRTKYVQIENKNALLELLEEGREIEKIFLASNAYKDPKTKRIVDLAGRRGIPMEKLARRALSRRSRTSSKESVIGMMQVELQVDLPEMMERIYADGKEPNILIFGDIRYPHNVGAIFRTAFATGINGVITPVEKGNLLTDEIIRISMGTALRIPICEMSLFAAIKDLQTSYGVKVISLDMEGKPCFDADLTGPTAFILGSEDTGVSSKLLERSDELVSIPMKPGLGSLNVSVAASVLSYEKVRQEMVLDKTFLTK